MVNTIVATLLILHGLVHGVLALVPNPDTLDADFGSFFSPSWLLTKLGISEMTGKWISIILALIAMIGFIAAGLALSGFLVPFTWWRTLAIAATVVSLLLFVIFWHRYFIIGVLIDGVILALLIFANWTPV
jgi:hypothetical protein